MFNFTRKVCLENNTNLYEYWRFLDTTILWDIQDRQNLSFLELVETHLANKRSEIETSLPTSPDSNMTGDTEFFSADESLFSDNFEDAQNDTITDLCEQFEFVQLSSPKNKHLPKISVSECQSREFLGQPDESSFLTPTRPSFRKQRTKFFSASEKDTDPFSILPSAAKKLPYLFLETNDYYSKTDQQFYEALVQFFVDTEDLESLLSEKYPEIRHWYDHVKKNLMPDNQKVKNLRTPCRL